MPPLIATKEGIYQRNHEERRETVRGKKPRVVESRQPASDEFKKETLNDVLDVFSPIKRPQKDTHIPHRKLTSSGRGLNTKRPQEDTDIPERKSKRLKESKNDSGTNRRSSVSKKSPFESSTSQHNPLAPSTESFPRKVNRPGP
jgi:hypothetical protein